MEALTAAEEKITKLEAAVQVAAAKSAAVLDLDGDVEPDGPQHLQLDTPTGGPFGWPPSPGGIRTDDKVYIDKKERRRYKHLDRQQALWK